MRLLKKFTESSKKPVNILFPFIGVTIGGSHLSSLELVKNLSREEYEPIILVHKEGLFSDYLKKEGLPYVFFPLINIPDSNNIIVKKIILFSNFFKMAIFILKNRIMIVHSNDGGTHEIWCVSTHIAGKFFIRHQRSLFRNHNKDVKKAFSLKIFHPTPDILITISEYTKKTLPIHMQEQAIVIRNPFNISIPSLYRSKARNCLKARIKCSKDAKIISFVANLIERKRPDIFVEMANIISNIYQKEVLFLIFGETREPTFGQIQSLINKYRLAERCIVMGAHFPIEPWMAASDILVAPAIEEPFGRTLVESMICGTPVIASNMGGHTEIIDHGKTGFLVHPDDPQAFADVALQLLENQQLWQEISRSGRKWAMNNCSVDQHLIKIQKIYRSILFRQ